MPIIAYLQKMFNTYNNDVISICQYYSGYLCFDRLYDLRRYLFLSKLLCNAFIDEKSLIDKIDFRDYCLFQNKRSEEHTSELQSRP